MRVRLCQDLLCIRDLIISSHWIYNYSKTPIYRVFWGKGNNRGKSGFAANRNFACLQYAYKALFGGINWPR